MHALFRRAPKGALAVLGFHNITPTFSQPHLSPEFPERFRKLLRLVKARYEIVTITEGFRRLQQGEALSRPMLAFIFDDGYADTEATVMPIMRDEGMVGTSYVVIDALESGVLPWYEELGRLVYRMDAGSLVFDLAARRLEYRITGSPRERDDVFWQITRELKQDFDPVTHSLIKELQAAHKVDATDEEARALLMTPAAARNLIAHGFEVGSHSWTHPILPSLEADELDREIIASKSYLEGLLEHEVTSFCYPNGDNDQRCVERAEAAGYDCAVSMACGANLTGRTETFRLKRAAMSEDISWIWPLKTRWHVHAALVHEEDA